MLIINNECFLVCPLQSIIRYTHLICIQVFGTFLHFELSVVNSAFHTDSCKRFYKRHIRNPKPIPEVFFSVLSQQIHFMCTPLCIGIQPPPSWICSIYCTGIEIDMICFVVCLTHVKQNPNKNEHFSMLVVFCTRIHSLGATFSRTTLALKLDRNRFVHSSL